MPRTGDLPTTAYLVLGVLAANDEQLTAGEIKLRAEFSVGYFYWSPSVSHVRRELDRLLARQMVKETGAQAGKRAITLYEVTRGRPRGSPQVGAALPQQRPGRHQTSGHPQDVACPR